MEVFSPLNNLTRLVAREEFIGLWDVVLRIISDWTYFWRLACKAFLILTYGLYFQVESIVLGEDCALLRQDSSVGRRGMCGMVFIFKVTDCKPHSQPPNWKNTPYQLSTTVYSIYLLPPSVCNLSMGHATEKRESFNMS